MKKGQNMQIYPHDLSSKKNTCTFFTFSLGPVLKEVMPLYLKGQPVHLWINDYIKAGMEIRCNEPAEVTIKAVFMGQKRNEIYFRGRAKCLHSDPNIEVQGVLCSDRTGHLVRESDGDTFF
jgi:hypothetical protein